PHNRFFGNWLYANKLPAGEDTPTADPGAAGIPNILRYAFGLDPMHPARGDLPRPHRHEYDDVEYLTLAFTRRGWAQDIEYVAEWSPDLINWEPLGNDYIISTVKTTSGWEEVLLRGPQPMAEDPK